MKLLRYSDGKAISWGAIYPNQADEVREVIGDIFGNWRPGASVGKLDQLEIAPLTKPNNIVGLALNYLDLVGESAKGDEPLVFLKAASTLACNNQPIRRPKWIDKMWVETELAVIVGKELNSSSLQEASDAILGITLANDVTAGNILGRDHHLARSKSLPTFCPVGDFLLTDTHGDDLRIKTTINGQITQESTTAKRLLNTAECLQLVSRFIPLLPGDIVLTGTPSGAMDSVVNVGDQAILEIESLGKLTNQIVEVD
jgi:2-keto-4-pentenoate hydratase/2-oxohepta-3-ene-1,7-dioic acid hydratase in catechol pathway